MALVVPCPTIVLKTLQHPPALSVIDFLIPQILIFTMVPPIYLFFFHLLYADGMSSMIGLPSDRALVEDDDCMRYAFSWPSLYDIHLLSRLIIVR